jgi:hypothetical protein
MGTTAQTTVKYTAPFTTSQATALRSRITQNAIIYRADIEAIRSAMFAIGHTHDITDTVIKHDVGNIDGGTTYTANAKTNRTDPVGSLSSLGTTISHLEINTMNTCLAGWKTHKHTFTDYY